MKLAIGVVAGLALFGCTEKDKPQPITPTAEPLPTASAAPALAALPSDPKDPRSCSFALPQQSCIPGSSADDWSCRSDCANDCTTCATACKGAGCQDDCLKARDVCHTKCVQYVADRQKERASNYGCKDTKSRPLDICKRAVTCRQKCKDDNDACRRACSAAKAPGCNSSITGLIESGNCFPLDDSP